MMYSGLPAFFILELEDGHGPTFWLHFVRVRGTVEGLKLSGLGAQASRDFGLMGFTVQKTRLTMLQYCDEYFWILVCLHLMGSYFGLGVEGLGWAYTLQCSSVERFMASG